MHGRGSSKCSKAQVIAALRKTGGAVYLTAKSLKVSHVTVLNYIKRWKEVEEVLREERGKLIDYAENRLLKAVKRGDAWAVAFCLKTIGKDRGYTEKGDNDHVELIVSKCLTFARAMSDAIEIEVKDRDLMQRIQQRTLALLPLVKETEGTGP